MTKYFIKTKNILNGYYNLLLRKIATVFFPIFAREKKYIFFESYPEMSGSPRLIYDELRKKGVDKQYQLVWLVESNMAASNDFLTIPFFGKTNIFQKMHAYWLLSEAKMIIDSNRYVYKINPDTFRLYARHGAPIKKSTSYSLQLGEVDAMLSLSDFFKEIDEREYPSAKGKIWTMGYPSNDMIFEKIDLYENNFWNFLTSSTRLFNKVIGWLPTFRQHRVGGKGSSYIFPYGIPIVKTIENFRRLNNVLEMHNILLVVQMHHAQAKNFPNLNFSNIVLVTQKQKEMMNVSTANLMNNFDAMITDYSGAYYEYLLLNRPIALTIDDYGEYAASPGFCINYFDVVKGSYLKDFSDLLQFVDEIAQSVDSKKAERETAMRCTHKYLDNLSTQRVVDCLCETVGL